jgi:Chain length determinant protein
VKRIWDRFSRRTWAVVLVAALLGAGGGLLRTYLNEYNYSATATVYVTPPVSANAGDALVADQYAANRTQLYVTLIKSPELAKAVDDRLQLGQKPEELADRVEGRATPLTSLLSITAEGVSPGDARNLVTAYADSLPDFAKSVEGSGGLRGSPSVVTVAYPIPEDPSFVQRYSLMFALAAGLAFLGFLYSFWYRRRFPAVGTREQLRRELHVALVEVVDLDSPGTQMRRLQAELFTPRNDARCLIIAGAKSADGSAAFSELLTMSLEAAGRAVRRVARPADFGPQHDSYSPDGLAIVDVPALLESSASAAVLNDAGGGGAVLVTRRGITSLRDAREVQNLLTMNDVTLRAAVILQHSRLPWRRFPSHDESPTDGVDESDPPWPLIDVLEAEKHGRKVRAD